jgi:outer membrane lipoprotein-sorting protein
MRAVGLLLLTLLAPVLVQEDDAERTCRDMEKRLLAAKTLRVSFAITVEVDTQKDNLKGTKDNLKGTMWLAEDNKSRIEIEGTMSGGKELKMLMVSDGSKMVANTTGAPAQRPHATPKGAGELIRGTLARAGLFAGLFYSAPDRKEPTLDDLFQVFDFKILAREDRGIRKILVIEHKIAFRGAREKGLITVWVDSKAFLPEKRVFTINDKANKVRVMEAYEGLKVDDKLDNDLFELPKD